MQLIRAMPVASFVILALLWVRSANLSVIVSFTHVLPVVYAGVLGGIADTDPKLLEMAKVYRLPLTARLRYIWLPGIFPSFCESCTPPWACAGRAASPPRSSVCRTTAWATRSTARRSPCPRRMCSRGRSSSCCCRRRCPGCCPGCCRPWLCRKGQLFAGLGRDRFAAVQSGQTGRLGRILFQDLQAAREGQPAGGGLHGPGRPGFCYPHHHGAGVIPLHPDILQHGEHFFQRWRPCCQGQN